jgi:hypothetical protein
MGMTASPPVLHVQPGTEWAAVLGRAAATAPEAFGPIDGGELLGQAVTQGPDGGLLSGNFPEHSRYPASI